MGVCVDVIVKKYEIICEQQDEFVMFFYKCFVEFISFGVFVDEIVVVYVSQCKGDLIVIMEDEEFKWVKFEKVFMLCLVFIKDGMVMVVNVFIINDGAIVLVLVSEEKFKELNLMLLVKVVSFVDVVYELEWFIIVLIKVVFIVLKWVGFIMNDIDYFEVNEVFVVVMLVFNKMFDVFVEKMNVFGGVVFLGYLLGVSGVCIIIILNNVLQ